MKEFQEKNCKGCKFADRKKIGTGEPCCTYWQQIEVHDQKCLMRQEAKMGYTKGEWKKEGNKITKFGQGIIAVCPSPNIGGVFEFVANAHLIAAAPEMYEALKEISEGKGRFSLDPLTHASNTIDDMKELALKALAKAEGK